MRFSLFLVFFIWVAAIPYTIIRFKRTPNYKDKLGIYVMIFFVYAAIVMFSLAVNFVSSQNLAGLIFPAAVFTWWIPIMICIIRTG